MALVGLVELELGAPRDRLGVGEAGGITSASLALPAIVYCSASCAVISGASLYAHDMKSTGRAPYWR
jgi:hypothetical protein